MYYKITKEADLYGQLLNFLDQIQEVNEKAADLAEATTGQRQFIPEGGSSMAGGIHAFCFKPDQEIPRIFKKVNQKLGFICCRVNGKHKEGKDLRKLMKELPRVSRFNLIEMFGLKGMSYPGFTVSKELEFALAEMSEKDAEFWKRPKHVKELTFSQYKAALKEINEARKQTETENDSGSRGK